MASTTIKAWFSCLVIGWAQSGVGEPTSICIATLTGRRRRAGARRERPP